MDWVLCVLYHSMVYRVYRLVCIIWYCIHIYEPFSLLYSNRLKCVQLVLYTIYNRHHRLVRVSQIVFLSLIEIIKNKGKVIVRMWLILEKKVFFFAWKRRKRVLIVMIGEYVERMLSHWFYLRRYPNLICRWQVPFFCFLTHL